MQTFRRNVKLSRCIKVKTTSFIIQEKFIRYGFKDKDYWFDYKEFIGLCYGVFFVQGTRLKHWLDPKELISECGFISELLRFKVCPSNEQQIKTYWTLKDFIGGTQKVLWSTASSSGIRKGCFRKRKQSEQFPKRTKTYKFRQKIFKLPK